MSPAGGSDGGLDSTSRVYRRKPPDEQEAFEAAKRTHQAVAMPLLFARRYNPRTAVREKNWRQHDLEPGRQKTSQPELMRPKRAVPWHHP